MKGFKYFPTTKLELTKIIEEHIKKGGNSADLNDIDVSKIDNLSHLFTKFPNIENIHIDNWDMSKVVNASHMFDGCELFNSDISNWDVSSLKDASYMFCNCLKFNQDLSNWKVNKLEQISCMFYRCTKLKYNMEKWGERLSENIIKKYAFTATYLTPPSWYKK